MKLLGIRIKDFQQFKDLKLDFTDANGEPLQKVCFIGSNGTGKSILLRLIRELLCDFDNPRYTHRPLIAIKYKLENNSVIYYIPIRFSYRNQEIPLFFTKDIEIHPNWFDDLTSMQNDFIQTVNKYTQYIIHSEKTINSISYQLSLTANSKDLFIYAPPESGQNLYMTVVDVPQTSLNEALELIKSFPLSHIVSNDKIQDFWKILIYHIKKRDNEREQFENREENLNKTKKQLLEEFDKENPKILEWLAGLWNRILDQAGLEFDYKQASNPIQLNENLKAYIKIKSTKQNIPYNQLSTGIRNFIFRIGHICSLYFNREIKNGFLLVDEPENSLFPDFLFNLVDIYQEVIRDKNGENNTQFFTATHSPIIAAQFEPEERIILEWNDEGYVDAHKGYAPAGDDPNDVLEKDFGVQNLLGKKGLQKWEQYLELRKKLRQSNDEKEKENLLSEINKIGNLYNFGK